jgi:hypothetical protein
MSIGLQEPEDTPQVFSPSEESLNSTSLQTLHYCKENSKSNVHFGCGYNSSNGGRMSAHNVFVLGVDGKPLTPTTNAKARKLLKEKQAKPVWNKFNNFGIQMLVETRKEVPLVVLGQDWGTKFEGYSLISGKENNLNVMWKLPDKKKLIKKLEERRTLRRARRWRNCRRREARFDNRKREGFIAPSQLQIVDSRLKCMNEFFMCYPVQKVGIEDVCFNHRDNKWGKNFSTVEVGKQKIYNYIRNIVGVENLILFKGFDTQEFRKKNNLNKSSDKSGKKFSSHCVDSYVIANELSNAIPNKNIAYVDDNYRCIRRKLHDSQFAKGGIRAKFSSGNFERIRKGTMCKFGQIVGGTGNNVYYQDFELQDNGRKIYQKGKAINKIGWLSHHFKCMEVIAE